MSTANGWWMGGCAAVVLVVAGPVRASDVTREEATVTAAATSSEASAMGHEVRTGADVTAPAEAAPARSMPREDRGTTAGAPADRAMPAYDEAMELDRGNTGGRG